jgi:hypothetical protein
MASTLRAVGYVAWAGLPAAVYFGLEAFEAFAGGRLANAAGHLVLGLLFLAAPFATGGRLSTAPVAIAAMVAGAAGLFVWSARPHQVAAVIGYLVAVVSLVTLIEMTRRSGRLPPATKPGTVREFRP